MERDLFGKPLPARGAAEGMLFGDRAPQVSGASHAVPASAFQAKVTRMTTRFLCTAMIAAAMLGASLSSSAAADPTGTWLTQDGKATVRIADCGGALCGAIISLKEPNDPETGQPKTDKNNADASLRSRPMLGVQIVLGMTPNSKPASWTGQVYNAEDGKTYAGTLTLQDAKTIKLEGCILGGLICKTSTWIRS
jgi:uncharacterized protein (DUF2147 family)